MALMGCGPLTWAAPIPLSTAIRNTLAEHPSLEGRPFELQLPDLSPFQNACSDWWVELPLKIRMMGLLRVQIGCASRAQWSRALMVNVTVKGAVLVSTHNLSPGQALQDNDWKVIQTELSKLPADIIEDENQLKNKEIVRFIRAGAPLSLNDLRSTSVIKNGDLVKLSFVGQGFTLSTNGQAMSNAAVGDTVKVRTAEGKVIQGVVLSKEEVEVTLDQR
jgi:flagella basal body P-ring formation protein FlgA